MSRDAGADLAYADPAYAASLAEFGEPVGLRRSGGWLLERPIHGTGHHDLTGPYPLFSCVDWDRLEADLVDQDDAVSVVLVADPLADVSSEQLARIFPDHLSAFKPHVVRDLARPVALPSSHRRHLRRASSSVSVSVSTHPLEHLDAWLRLYGALAARHGLHGMRAFSLAAFRRQLTLPGMVAVLAERSGEVVSMTLWLVAGDRAYYHLGASSDLGREVTASYALFDAAFDHLRRCGVRWVDLGGAAGGVAREDGLLRFKQGWGNTERLAHLCGRILDHRRYESLSKLVRGTDRWFPAYRAADADMAGEAAARAAR